MDIAFNNISIDRLKNISEKMEKHSEQKKELKGIYNVF